MSAFTEKFDSRKDAIVTMCYVLTTDLDDQGKKHYCEAIDSCWDTGATNTSISSEIVNALKLKSIGKSKVSVYGGQIIDSDIYRVDLMLPGNIKVKNLEVMFSESNDYDVVIGMDVMTLGDLAISNKDEHTTFSFRIPSEEELVF